MKEDNKEIQIYATGGEKMVLMNFLRTSESVNAFTIGVLKEPSLKEFFTRNFQDDSGKIDKWINVNVQEQVTARVDGTLTEEIYELEYELDEDESIDDVDWEEVANDERGYGSFDYDHTDVRTEKTLELNMHNFDDLKEVA